MTRKMLVENIKNLVRLVSLNKSTVIFLKNNNIEEKNVLLIKNLLTEKYEIHDC